MNNKKSKAAIRWNKSLRIRLSILLVIAPLLLAVIMIFVSLSLFNNRILDENTDKAEIIASILAESIDGDSIDRYLDTLEKDDEYERVLELMGIMQKNPEVMFIYVVRVIDSGMLFVFDADEDEDTVVTLGTFELWFGDGTQLTYDEFWEKQGSTGSVRDISYSEWGWLLTVFHPILRSDGSITAFACVDISMDAVMSERQILVGLLTFIILIFFVITILINIFAIQGWIFKPIGELINLVTDFRHDISSTGDLTVLKDEEYTGNELEVLKDALNAMQTNVFNGFDRQTKELEYHATMLETVFDSIPDLTYIKDLDLRFIHVNTAMLEHYGLKPYQVIGKKESEIWGPGELDKNYDLLNIKVINDGKMLKREEPITHVDGSVKIYETIRLPIIVEGATVSVLGIARDITKRKETENLREERYKYSNELTNALASITESEKFSSGDLKEASELISQVACRALKSSRVGLWSIDNKSNTLKCITYYNLATESHTVEKDMSLAECHEYVDLLKTERLIVTSDARIPSPLSAVFEQHYGPDIRATLDAPIRIGGKPVGVVCIEQDATEEYDNCREWTIDEQNFASSLADFTALSIESNDRRTFARRTELLLNSLPGMVFQAENNPPEFKTHFISEGCFALTGYSREEIMGDSPIQFYDIVYPDDLPGLKKLMEETLYLGMPLETTYRIVTKYGAIKWIWDRSHITDYDNDGNPLTFEGFYTDITEQRRLEAAEAASNAKSEFLSNMSHEMRTPLNAIIGMTAIGNKTDDIEGKTHALNKIGDASSHLLGMVNDILDMAKIEANKLELLSSEFSFENMIEKVMTMIHFRADEKKQVLTVNIDKRVPPFVIGDEQRLSQVLINILWNAVKFTQTGGNIHMDISVKKKRISSCELKVEISDDGIGISPEQQAKLFDVFEQADSKTERVYGGTGLGLAIAKRIIEMMDGRIWAESELGKGAKFFFTVFLGIGTKTGESSGPVSEDVPSGFMEVKSGEFSGKNLLVVEDVEINREILIALLGETGVAIDCAENGREAIEMVSADLEKYDAILMDLQMPHMGGLEATRLIREMPLRQKGKVPIIAMTANVFKDDIDACFSAGMNDHLGKPLDIDKLMDKLAKYLR